MKLLVDDRWFGTTGIGRYAKEIIQRVPSDVTVEKLSKTWAIRNPITPLLLGIEINRKAPDLFWSPGFMPPVISKSPYIITVHDLIHLKYGSKMQVVYYNHVIRPLLGKASCVLTVSEYTRCEILNWAGMPPDKVIAVNNAVSGGYTTEGIKFNPGYKYLLYVGNKRRHKNLERLLTAFSQAELPDEIKLVCTGDTTKELSELADKLKISHRLEFLGFVPETDLPSVYRGALAVLLVSLYEGFGIPLIESMACGVPVLTSSVSAMPEVTAGSAYLVDPLKVDEISSGIEKIVNDIALRKNLIDKGMLRSREFSWDDTASKVWNIIKSVSK